MPNKCPKCNTEWPDSVVLCPRDGERVIYMRTGGADLVEEVVPQRRKSQIGRMRMVAPKAAASGMVAEMGVTASPQGSGGDEASQQAALEAELTRESQRIPSDGGSRGMVLRTGSQAGLAMQADEATSEPGLAESGAKTSSSAPRLEDLPLVPKAAVVGDLLGNYKLLEVLGEGGMGTVFLAEHTVLKRRDALKVLLPEFCGEPTVVKRFFHEARAVNLIHHPNIIDIKDFVEGEEHPPYIVMEYIEGESLSHYIRHNAPIDPETVVAIATQICSALQAVHDQGIAHRDLKPDNVFLRRSPDGQLKAKLLDFGVAKFIGNQETFLKTLSGAAVGTPEFMAPEQIVGEEVDHRIDIYALGVILYEMLTSRQPFTATTVGELVTAHLTAAPTPPVERLAQLGLDPIPPELNDTVLQCLAKEASERVYSMEALRKMLRKGIGETTSPLPMPALEELGHRATKRSRLPWIFGGVAALVLVGVGGAFGLGLFGPKSSDPRSDGSGPAVVVGSMDADIGVAPQAAPRKVWVTSVPGGASLFCLLDGRYLGKTPTSVVLKPGEKLAVRLRMDGFRESRSQIHYSMKEPLRVVLAAKPLPPDNGMTVAGTNMSTAPPMRPPMRPGMRPVMHTVMRPVAPPDMTTMDMRPMDMTTMGGMRDLGGTLDPFGMAK